LKRENCTLQSEIVDEPVLSHAESANETQQETLQVIEEVKPAINNFGTEFEATYSEHTDEIASLGRFLERPVMIYQYTWNEADTFDLTPPYFYPWQLYFNNTYIKSKLQYFSRLHCNLNLTFRFNASPFYYGMLRACYDPLSTGKFEPLTTNDIMPMSTMPGITIEPQVSSSCEMVLPYLWPHTWLDTNVASQFAYMGKMYLQIFAPLRSANGVTGEGITISVYAHASEVEIAGPTTAPILQTGIISGPAGAIADFAKSLSGITSISPYARAVNIGATAVSRIAQIFGYSNPPITSDVQPFQNKVFHAFANTETSMPIDKLCLDPNNEITVDNRVTGASGDDPLLIKNLASIPAVIGVVSWDSSIAANTIIQYGEVSPVITQSQAGTGQTLKYYTPSSWVGNMFRFWRGGMRYHFRVVRSIYSKGRLIVSWDPNICPTSLGIEAAVFSKVFDLSSSEQEFIVDIPYKAISPWLKCVDTACLSSSYISHYKDSKNGCFVLGVLNPLTGPTATQEVSIIISAEAMEDMEFAAPDTLPLYTTQAAVQSEIINGSLPDGIKQDGLNVAPNPVDQSIISYSDRIPEFTVGERVASLRVLLHRTTKSMTQFLGLNTPGGTSVDPWCYHTVNCFDRLPPVYGFQYADSYAWGTSVISTGSKPCNFCTNHPINWILAAFVGFRGTVNVHANVHTNGNVSDVSGMSLARTDHNFCGVNATNNVVRNTAYAYFGLNSGPQNIMRQCNDITTGTVPIPLWPTGQGGMTLTNGKTQMALSAAIPQYSRVRFTPAHVNFRHGDFQDIAFYDTLRLDADFSVAETSDIDGMQFPRVDMYWSTGVDFNPVFFCGVPRFYYYVPPTIVTTNV